MNVCFIKQFAHLALLTLAISQALALLTPLELYKLQGLRFKLQTDLPDGTRLPDGATLTADSPEKKILDELGISVGAVPCVEAWASGFSPLIGALVWNNELINNLYFYGPASKFEETTNGTGASQYVISKAGDPFIDLVRYLFHAPEGSHELKVSEYNNGALQALVELPHFGAIMRAQLAGQEISAEQLEHIKNTFTGSKSTRRRLAETIMTLGEKIKRAKMSSVFPSSFIGFVLSAVWYRVVQSDQLNAELKNTAVTRLDAWDEGLKVLIDGFGTQTNPHERIVSLQKYFKDAATSDNKVIATFAFLSFIPYPPLIKQGCHFACKFDRKITFPDCGENTLHNLFDFLMYDLQNPKTYQFPKYLADRGLKPLPALQDFYTKKCAVVGESATKCACQAWTDLITGVPGAQYSQIVGPEGNRGGCDLIPSSDVMLTVIRYLLGIPELKAKKPGEPTADNPSASAPTEKATAPDKPKLEKWTDLQALLSIPGVRSARVDGTGEKVKITIYESGLERWIKLKMSSGHAEAAFPPASELSPDSINKAVPETNVRLLLALDDLTPDLKLACAHVYARPLDSMNDFDNTIAALVNEHLRQVPTELDHVRHWFDATIIKWSEMPDNSPDKIINLVWEQVEKHGPLEKEACEFLNSVKEKLQLHESYLNSLAEGECEFQIIARASIIPEEEWATAQNFLSSILGPVTDVALNTPEDGWSQAFARVAKFASNVSVERLSNKKNIMRVILQAADKNVAAERIIKLKSNCEIQN